VGVLIKAVSLTTALVAAAMVAATGAAATAAASSSGAPAAQTARNDAMRQLNQIDVPQAWKMTQGRGVTVAVLDTGTDASIPDLTGSVTLGPDYTVGADPKGYKPPLLHGTYIAALIAGHGSGKGNSLGVVGVAPQAHILAVRVILDDREPGVAIYNSSPRYTNSVAEGVNYAVKHGAQVINMSLGSAQPTRGLRAAVGNAIAHGVVVVASAGNSGTAKGGYAPYEYPASFTGVISVAAVNAAGIRAPFSEKNASVELSAPGVNVVSAGPGGQYMQGSGTSPAAAFVSGVAALIKSRYPHLSPALVEQALVSSTTHRPPAGYSPSTGFGEVDAAAALARAAKLSGSPIAGGVPAGQSLGPAHLGPIAVTHRNSAQILAFQAAASAAGVGFLICVALIVMWARRAMRGRRRVAES
jgi:type VII secretion-associated serine protease mycosin